MPNYFIPQINSPQTKADSITTRQGVGLPTGHFILNDVTRLNCRWFYDWNCSTDLLNILNYVPMTWSGSPYIDLDSEYSGYLLALNEPELITQGNLKPYEAARRIFLTQNKFPKAKMIIGGCSYFGRDWLQEFLIELGSYKPAGWHVHGYVEWKITANDVVTWFTWAREKTKIGEFWISEFAECTGKTDLLNMVRETNWIDRYAWFANRLSGLEEYYPKHWVNPALINSAGDLTEYGKQYL